MLSALVSRAPECAPPESDRPGPPLSVRRSRPWLGLALLPLLGLGCAPDDATFIPYPVAREYRAQQDLRLLRPGWRLTAVMRRVDRPTAIVHRVEVIPEIAGQLVGMGGRARRKTVGEIACPAADHPIWQKLDAGQDVEVDLVTEKRGVFATVSCRRAVL